MADLFDNVPAFIEKFIPNSDFILFRKCGLGVVLENGGRGIPLGDGRFMELPTDYQERTSFVEMIDIGPKCKQFSKEHCARSRPDGTGETVLAPEFTGDQTCVDYEKSEYWLDREKHFPPILFRKDGCFPLSDRVVCQMDTPEFKGGVRLPDEEIEMQRQGVVIAVGPRAPKALKVGDRIATGQIEAYRFTLQDKVFLCAGASDFLKLGV